MRFLFLALAIHTWTYTTAEIVRDFNSKDDGILYQEDIILTPEHYRQYVDDGSSETSGGLRQKRQILTGERLKWKEGINYKFDKNTRNDGLLVTTLYNACASDVGKVGGWQDLYLGESCEDFGGMAHELGHALGLLHTMSRRDRNDYIFVDLINIKLEYAEEFEKHERTKFYGVGYDYGSVMHYRQRSGFSSLDYLMIPFDSKYKNTFGSKMISFADLKMINSHYNCLEKCKSERPDLKCQHGGYQHPRNCSRCLCPSGYGGTDCSERPSDGCGQELVAKETWQNFTISIQNEDPKKYLDGYKKCNYWIRSPEKTRIKIRLEDIRFRSTAGCTNNGIEIKAKKDQTLTGYRFCYTDEEDLVLSPRFNIAPIIAYSRVNDTGTAVISYRYVESSKDDEEQD